MMPPFQPNGAFTWTQEPWGRALRCAPLALVADHFYTTRDLVLAGDPDAASWARVARAIGLEPGRLLRARQVHGADVFVRRSGDPLPSMENPPEADVMATNDSSTALAVHVADCLPLLLADRRRGAVAAAHAGWRGTVLGVAVAAVRTLNTVFGARLEDIVAAIGPGIGPCCYQVGDELLGAFARAGHGGAIGRWFSTRSGRHHLDLWRANRDQLLAAGLAPEHVHVAALCTSMHLDLFYSHRAEGAGTGRIVGVIRASPVLGGSAEN